MADDIFSQVHQEAQAQQASQNDVFSQIHTEAQPPSASMLDKLSSGITSAWKAMPVGMISEMNQHIGDWANQKAEQNRQENLAAVAKGQPQPHSEVTNTALGMLGSAGKMGTVTPTQGAIAGAAVLAPEVVGPALVAHGGYTAIKNAPAAIQGNPDAAEASLTGAAEAAGGGAMTGEALAGGLKNTNIGKVVQKANPGELVRDITGTTPERIAELQQVPQKISDIRQLAVDAEAKAKAAAKAAYPDIKTPVKIGPPVSEAEPFDPTATVDAKQTEIPFKQAQEKYSQLGIDARAAHIARMRGLITGFDEADILRQKSELGDAMQDAAEADGKLDDYNAAQKQFRQYMTDFHNRGSAVEPLLEANPSDTVKIANHFLNPDKGARTVSTLSKYGIDTSPINDLLSRGATPLKIDVTEATKLAKVGPESYAQQRLQESIDQAEFNRLQSSAQARLPAWAMRKTSELPLVPEALQPNIPTRFLISKLLRSNFAKSAVGEGAIQLRNLGAKP
jgi:hypothetical protein